MTGDVRDSSARRPALAIPWPALLAASLLLPMYALVGRWPPTGDIAWHLYVARALVHGARLGSDIVEVNPPLVMWLKVPVVALADALGVATGPAWFAAVGMTCVAAALLAGALIRRLRALRPGAAVALTAWCAVVFVFVPAYEFGQREHLAAVLVVPFLCAYALHADGDAVPAPLAWLAGLAGGIGFSLKPYFVVALAGAMAVAWLRQRLWPPPLVLRVTVAVGVTYVVSVLVLEPGWVAMAREYFPVYGAYFRRGPAAVLAQPAHRLAFMAVAALAVMVIRRRGGTRTSLVAMLAAAVAGFMAAVALQGKPWVYLSVAAEQVTLCLLGLFVALAFSRDDRFLRRAAVAIGAVLTLLVASLGLYVALELRAGAGVRIADTPYGRVLAVLRRTPSAASVGALTASHATPFPVVLDADRRWAQRLPSQWPLLAAHPVADSAGCAAAARLTLASDTSALARRLAGELAGELERAAPAALIVDRPQAWNGWRSAPACFDLLRYYGSDERFRALLAAYRERHEIGPYVVLTR